MAGTPTPNYNFPTYAETDTPNLAGAYNQAVNAIDAKIKEVADTIPSDVDVPDATSTTKGIAKLYDSSTVGAGTQDDGGITPKAVKDYVDAKVPVEQQAYTGTAPITVDNASHKIGITSGTDIKYSNGNYTTGSPGVVVPMNSDATVNYFNTGSLPPSSGGKLMASSAGIREWVLSRTPNASTTVKGLVQLTTSPASGDSTMAVTGSGVVRLLGDRKTNATTNVTVDMLNNLYVDTATGGVYYKAPSE